MHYLYLFLVIFCFPLSSCKRTGLVDDCLRRRFAALPSIVTVTDRVNGDNACGGTLIGEHVVLTAAQCLFLSRQTRTPLLVLDPINARKQNRIPETRRTVQPVRHPKFSSKLERGHDIALLRFEQATSLRHTPIASEAVQVGTRLIIIGGAGKVERILRAVVADVTECENVGVAIDRKSMTCIFGELPCKGDEGGSILNEATGELVGVVSITSSCQSKDGYLGIILLNYRGLNEWTRSLLFNLESAGFQENGVTVPAGNAAVDGIVFVGEVGEEGCTIEQPPMEPEVATEVAESEDLETVGSPTESV